MFYVYSRRKRLSRAGITFRYLSRKRRKLATEWMHTWHTKLLQRSVHMFSAFYCMTIFALFLSLCKYTPCPKKTKQICFCQNFVKFPPILIIFGRKMGNDPNICAVHSFSTSPNLRHHLTVLNGNVPNCYITPKLLVIDRSHWRPQFNRGSRTFRDHSNFRQFVHIW